MKIQKRWLVGGLAALLLGATSCQKSNSTIVPEIETEGTTFMSVAINLNLQPEELLRAGEKDNEHNPVGHWEGRDLIKGVDIYIVDAAAGTVVTKGLNVLTSPVGGADSSNGADGVYATGAWKVEPGQKTLYAVVNNGGAIKTALDQAAATGATTFKAAYETAYEYNIAQYAKEEGNPAKDVILMSGEPKSIEIKPDITQSQATIQTPGTTNALYNQFPLEVRRSAARVAVTYDGTKLPSAKGKVAHNNSVTLGEIQVTGWYYGQFEKTTKVQWDATATDLSSSPKTFLNRTTKSPNFDFVVTDEATDKQKRIDSYDYSTLKTKVDIKALTANTKSVANIVADGNMKFLAETTHQYGPEDRTGYRKGNTPYVLIETVFTPDEKSWASDNEKSAYQANGDLFYSTYNGKFYADEARAKEASANNVVSGTQKDGVIKFTGGKMYYTAWLNPDTTDARTWFNSPVLRNNIYHIHVTGFKKLGFSGDPFNPTPDNDKPVDPDDDVPSVTEKLNVKETWMSTEITVVNWGVHSYDIGF